MRIRSLTAALASVACVALAALAIAPARADDKDETDAVAAVANTVKLEIQIAGLGAEGATIEIKPAHPGCKFAKVEKRIARGTGAGVARLAPIALTATTTSPDRDCSFEITVTEPGRKPMTFRRGLQLSPAGTGNVAAGRTLKCYLPAAVIASKDAPANRPLR